MSDLRQRKLKDDTSAPHINVRSRTVKQPRRLKKVFILLIVVALCVTYLLGLFAGQTLWFDGLAKSLGYESVYHHAVIIDAGSTGTRVLAYKFRVPFTVFGPANLDLVDEYFEQSKPGLSSFVNEPEKGADQIVQLIKKAEFLTPPEKRRETPLLVRATAGLRLLPKEKAQLLIDTVAQAIAKLGYMVSNNAVQIMDGSDEGIFIWYTVNLLHNLMEGDTMAALDLGGGSTQITFEVSEPAARDDLFLVPAAGKNITLYTHSYLGLGLHAARYGIFRLEAGDDNATSFTSVCVDPIVQNEPWVYANTQYLVSGAPRVGLKRAQVLSRCHAAVRALLRRSLAAAPARPAPRAPRAPVAAMSYFYDVAADAGVIDVMRGGTVTVSSYRQFASRACAEANIEQPWACINIVYIISLLEDAYQLKPNDPVSLFKKIDGHEVSWALGLAYTTVMNRIAAAPPPAAPPAPPAPPAPAAPPAPPAPAA